MAFKTIITLSLAAAALTGQVAALTARQSESTSVGSFFAYGDGISGLPVFYVDAVAYIGQAPPPNASVSANVTFHVLSSNSSFMVTANNSESLPANFFYIDDSPGAFDSAGFTDFSNSSSDIVTTGFKVYGNQLSWVNNAGSLKQLWWAKPTDVNGLWTLNWNVDTKSLSGAVPVTVRNVAPTTIGSKH